MFDFGGLQGLTISETLWGPVEEAFVGEHLGCTRSQQLNKFFRSMVGQVSNENNPGCLG